MRKGFVIPDLAALAPFEDVQEATEPDWSRVPQPSVKEQKVLAMLRRHGAYQQAPRVFWLESHLDPAKDRDRDVTIERLRLEVERLQKSVDSRRIWRLGELQDRIGKLAGSDRQRVGAIAALGCLHRIAIQNGFDCLGAPQLSMNEGDVDFSWYDLSTRQAVTLAVDEAGATTLTWQSGGEAGQVDSPDEAALLKQIRWILRP